MNDLNGVPTQYTLRYSGVEFQRTEKTVEINYTSANETVSLTGLEAYTVYEISVSLSTTAGEGFLSSIRVRTLETGIVYSSFSLICTNLLLSVLF